MCWNSTKDEVAKIMFLHMSVILSTGEGVCLSACWDTPPAPPRADPHQSVIVPLLYSQLASFVWLFLTSPVQDRISYLLFEKKHGIFVLFLWNPPSRCKKFSKFDLFRGKKNDYIWLKNNTAQLRKLYLNFFTIPWGGNLWISVASQVKKKNSNIARLSLIQYIILQYYFWVNCINYLFKLLNSFS